MHKVYLGCSSSLSREELVQYFDIDPHHSDRISQFEQNFGSGYIEPGSFEIYDRSEYETLGFDANLLERLLP
jgi:hypothetical protein